jgi:hypothetical protein
MYTMKQCRAKSKRSGKRCNNWALKGKSTCKFHGGKSTGPRTIPGKERMRRSKIEHGMRTKEAMRNAKSMRELLRDGNAFLKKINTRK